MFLTGAGRTLGGPQILEDLPAPGEDVFAASFSEDLLRNPTSSALRFEELQRAEGDPFISPFGARLVVPDPEQLSSMVSAEEAREEIGALNITVPDEGIRRDHLDLLIESRREEVTRNSILARRDLSLLGEIELIGQSVVASALDPLNVGAAFVPVIREARFAAWAQRFGAVRARAGRGAIEGVAGAALVEPIVLAAATAEQSDYGAWDSLLNIALGGALGGGLHVTGGAAADAVRRARGLPTLRERVEFGDVFDDISARLEATSFADREIALRTAVGQLAIGQSVEVTPLLRTTAAFADVLAPAEVNVTVRGADLPVGLAAPAERAETVAPARRGAGDPLQPPESGAVAARASGQGVDALPPEAVLRDADGAPRLFESEPEARRVAEQESTSERRLEVVPVTTDEGPRFALAENLDAATVVAARTDPATLQVEADDVVQLADRQPAALPAVPQTNVLDDVIVERLRQPERFDITGEPTADGQRLSDEASAATDDITEELNEAMAELDSLRARGLLTAEDEARIAAASEVADDMQRRAASYRAAAHCLAA